MIKFDAKIEETIYTQTFINSRIDQINSTKRLFEENKKSITKEDVNLYTALIDQEISKLKYKVFNESNLDRRIDFYISNIFKDFL